MNLKEKLDKNQKDIDEVIHKNDPESIQKFRALVRERIEMLLKDNWNIFWKPIDKSSLFCYTINIRIRKGEQNGKARDWKD